MKLPIQAIYLFLQHQTVDQNKYIWRSIIQERDLVPPKWMQIISKYSYES